MMIDESESDSDEMEIQDHSVPMILDRPYHSICFAEPGKGGLAVGFTTKGLAAYLFAPDGRRVAVSTATPLFEQRP